jgi:hypothetical protein
MPRSGTTWVGRTLGVAPDAVYFNEPVSEVHVAQERRATFFEVDPSNPPADYVWPLRFAAAGVPAFGPLTVGEGFGVFGRVGKRVVIKEVNPLAIDWFVDALSPRLVYVVRHPAAVAVSLYERGWGWPVYEHRFLPERELPVVGPSYWSRIGAIQGVALAMAEQAAVTATVEYESLCAAPEPCFRDLYDIAGLTWTDAVAASLHASTQGDITRGADDPTGTTRNTADMANAWRARITLEQLREVRDGWEATNPSRYTADEDWTLF